ncbi:MAG: hypothetical protein BIFFINMI_00884 [Phycisphaerae bacterium]|nr:hypothetical protein [Phycisphaerae bacterium]
MTLPNPEKRKMPYLPLLFVAMAVLFWGAYVPMIHHGQTGFARPSPLHAFLFVGVAYFLTAVLAPIALLWLTDIEAPAWAARGIGLSTLAGVCGAVGALGVILALKTGGRPTWVAPMVFAGAPIVASLVAIAWDRPARSPSVWYWVGIFVAAGGAAMVLRFKP